MEPLAPTVKTVTLESRGPQQTRRLGQRLARALRPGDVLLLSGPLGSGKTVLVQGLARALGIREGVSSKSFVLLGEYRGRIKLYHADLYRLEGPAEAQDLGLDEYCGDGVLAVEWPERAWRALPQDALLISLEITGERTRRITLKATGPRSAELLASLEGRGWS
jgi:tRNA threonylcarbamoyladenosine biosynthesis protein TsaE